jgi:hypothetical protein
MQKHRLGKSGLEVSGIGLGCMGTSAVSCVVARLILNGLHHEYRLLVRTA